MAAGGSALRRLLRDLERGVCQICKLDCLHVVKRLRQRPLGVPDLCNHTSVIVIKGLSRPPGASCPHLLSLHWLELLYQTCAGCPGLPLKALHSPSDISCGLDSQWHACLGGCIMAAGFTAVARAYRANASTYRVHALSIVLSLGIL